MRVLFLYLTKCNKLIYHITHKKHWKSALKKNEYETPTLNEEGFIHCSPLEKVKESANRFFKDHYELLVLCIDEDKVIPEIIREDLYDTGFEFPHIYGKLNLDAVIKVIELKKNINGSFDFP
ncbi:MAG: DUF952 domain-containing protein [Ignavibacteria bacterium]